MANATRYKPIKLIEHVVHGILILATGGGWLVVYLPRIILKQRQANRMTKEEKEEFKSQYKAGFRQKDSLVYKTEDVKIYNKRTFASEEEAENDDYSQYAEEYSFDLTGESYNRQNLLKIIRKHEALKLGEVFVDAILQLEPDNEFDDSAVKVTIEGLKVGYVPAEESWDVTEYIDNLSTNALQVKAKIGWDSNNPEPVIGVRLDFNF